MKNYRKPLYNLGNLPTQILKSLRDGNAGNLDTASEMIRIARERYSHPKVRELSKGILSLYKTKPQNFYDECIAIGEWTQKMLSYLKDPLGLETIQDPVMLIDQLEKRGEAYGDCDDMALFIITLLLSIGHQPYLVLARYPSYNSGFQHIYVCVYQKNYREQGNPRRLVLDAIVTDKKIGYEVPSSYTKEIKV